jgi:N-acetylglucosaminyl-diphospho-decaprenol L-rhamnosyltransferase
MTADIRVGIVSWNTAQLLDRTLSSLPDAIGGLSAEVVVVDNASADESVTVAKRHGAQVVEMPHNLGYAIGMNRALSGSGARALVALNPDTECPPRSLEQLARTLDEQPGAALVAPVLADAQGALQRTVLAYPGPLHAFENGFLPRRWRRDARDLSALSTSSAGPVRLENRWVIGAVHCIRRSALCGRDPYCTRWFMYVEDLELCWRLQGQGWAVVVRPDVTIVHHGGASATQRWGERTNLELKGLPNLYEWLATARSTRTARATALLNVMGLEAKKCLLALGASLGRRGRANDRRRRAEDLDRLEAYHRSVWRSLASGAVPDADLADSAPGPEGATRGPRGARAESEPESD